jgi:hypothetical protein
MGRYGDAGSPMLNRPAYDDSINPFNCLYDRGSA